MQRLSCVVSLLLLLGVLLAALSPVVAATARGEMLTAAAGGDRRGRDDHAGAANSFGSLPGPAAARGIGEVTMRREDEEVVVKNGRRFRTRKIPAAVASQAVPFGGRIPFTADYHSVHRHPPTHN